MNLTENLFAKLGSRISPNILRRWQLYVLLLIPVAYVIIFDYVPMGGMIIAFKNYDFSKGVYGSNWVGLDNFFKFFNSYQFGQIIKNTLTLSVYRLLAGFPIPILFALALNALPAKRYGKMIQTITFIPHFISTVVIVGLVTQLFNNRTGIYGTLFSAITGSGLGSAPNILSSGQAFKHLYVWSGIWQSTGYDAIIYIAALAGVDVSLHEAASIDGASHFQRVLHIDIPSILPTATILLILNCGKIMSVGYEKVFLMQNSLNISYSEIISTYVYKVGLTSRSDFSQATAIGMFNSVINFTLVTIVNKISKNLNGSGLF